jgi:hypothetical protein
MKTLRRKTNRRSPINGKAEPTWDIALLYPAQGDWSEEEYLSLPGNRLIEFCDGTQEFLPSSSSKSPSCD